MKAILREILRVGIWSMTRSSHEEGRIVRTLLQGPGPYARLDKACRCTGRKAAYG